METENKNDDLGRFEATATKLIQALDRLPTAIGTNKNIIRANVNAGGFAVWAVSIMASFMLGLSIMLVVDIGHQQNQIDNLNAYLAAIYMQAPSLKPKDKTDEHINHNHNATKKGQLDGTK